VQEDPELRFTASGLPVCNFTLRIAGKKPKDGSEQQPPEYFDITVWRDQAENVAASFVKGDRAVVVGQLKQSKWETPEGEKRSKIVVNAWNVGVELSYHAAVIQHADRREEVEPAGVGNEAPF
jgi:single-strand DNA-binding protein